jgi:hypothetical protein
MLPAMFDTSGFVILRARWARFAALVALGAPSVIASHTVAYALAHPDSVAREGVLAATGHGYWGTAILVAVAAGVLAALVQIASGLRAALHEQTTVVGVRRLWAMCVGAQVTTFVIIEATERALSGSLDRFASEPGVWLAIPVLVVLGAFVALVLSWLQRLGTRVAGARTNRAYPRRVLELVSFLLEAPPTSFGLRPAAARAPPGRTL